MKKIENIKKPNFLKKLFIKLCRIIGFEIIDQNLWNTAEALLDPCSFLDPLSRSPNVKRLEKMI